MNKFVFSIAACAFFFAVDSFAQISGKVDIVEKGNVVRKVVEGALVYLEGVEAPAPRELMTREVTISSRDKEFEPHLQAVPVGKTVSFPNMDDIMHNVFSISKGNWVTPSTAVKRRSSPPTETNWP